jgi:hypothetical protein
MYILFTKERIHHGIPEEPARRDNTLMPPLASPGPLKNVDESSPARKTHAQKNTRKGWQHFEHWRTAMPVRGDVKKWLPQKAGVEANHLRVQRLIIRTRVIMAAPGGSEAPCQI